MVESSESARSLDGSSWAYELANSRCCCWLFVSGAFVDVFCSTSPDALFSGGTRQLQGRRDVECARIAQHEVNWYSLLPEVPVPRSHGLRGNAVPDAPRRVRIRSHVATRRRACHARRGASKRAFPRRPWEREERCYLMRFCISITHTSPKPLAFGRLRIAVGSITDKYNLPPFASTAI